MRVCVCSCTDEVKLPPPERFELAVPLETVVTPYTFWFTSVVELESEAHVVVPSRLELPEVVVSEVEVPSAAVWLEDAFEAV